MNLRLRFILIPLLVLAAGLFVAGYAAYVQLHKNARDEVLRNAGLLMEMAAAVRNYTVTQVKPNLELQLMRVFLPQSVPAYAATETLGALKDKYPDYNYKEATLNPTNPRDKAVDWEVDLVQALRNDASLKEVSGERETPTGRSLYLARPIRIKEPNCLACHTDAPSAPKAMVALYGETNGFGWKLNETVGAQIISVPMSVPLRAADSSFRTFMAWLAGAFAVSLVALNLILSRLILRPLTAIAQGADRVSTGDFDVPEFAASGSGPIATIAQSFNRMRRSLEKAMKLIDG